ncbi:MAG: hypothetical protein RL481_890 [Pseudomonadota bacterium]|jgi:hypothetical protein
MGNFYVNICARGVNPSQLEAWLSQSGFKAYIGPLVDNWVCLVSEPLDTQDENIISRFASAISQGSNIDAISFLNHDDDVLMVELFQTGQRKAAYDSYPNYFSEEELPEDSGPALDNAEAFAALKQGVTAEQVKQVLLNPELSVFALETHFAISELLGLPEYAVGMGFSYVDNGESDADWIFVPGG